ncbi:MAG: ACP S-malonyltransferase [Planctomycetota bacterium]|jgi:[acyl-carrier-protein] S-malonyltransferase
MSKKVACLFPAFAMKYKTRSRALPEGYQDEVARFLAEASAVVEIDMRKFERPNEFALDDELQNALQEHYVSYVNSCAVGSLLKQRKITCDYVAGYSMGLFAALCHSSAVSFHDGLRLMHNTCTFAHEAVESGQYGMGVVIGLTTDQVDALIAENCREVEVTDVCSPRVVITSGRRSDLTKLLEAAKTKGGLHAKLLPVSLPFHSSLLRLVEGRIRDFLGQVEVRRPACGIVSCVNQMMLTSEEDVKEEVAGNVSHPINWLETMRRLLALGVDVFVECGLSESLCNLARNIDGDYRIYHPRKFGQLFASVT